MDSVTEPSAHHRGFVGSEGSWKRAGTRLWDCVSGLATAARYRCDQNEYTRYMVL